MTQKSMIIFENVSTIEYSGVEMDFSMVVMVLRVMIMEALLRNVTQKTQIKRTGETEDVVLNVNQSIRLLPSLLVQNVIANTTVKP